MKLVVNGIEFLVKYTTTCTCLPPIHWYHAVQKEDGDHEGKEEKKQASIPGGIPWQFPVEAKPMTGVAGFFRKLFEPTISCKLIDNGHTVHKYGTHSWVKDDYYCFGDKDKNSYVEFKYADGLLFPVSCCYTAKSYSWCLLTWFFFFLLVVPNK